MVDSTTLPPFSLLLLLELMKDPIKATKEAYYTLLNGAITINGSNVSVYIGEGNKAENNYYIILNAFSSESRDNKNIFCNDVTVSIDVCAKIINLLSDPYDSVDVITEKAFELILPTKTTTGLELGVNFEVKEVKMATSTHNAVQIIEGGRLMSRTTVFSQIINQI